MNAAGNWEALKTIVFREVNRILRIWGQTLVPPAITMTLYFAIFGNLIGSRIGQMNGMRYIDFIVPGLIMMAVIQSSYGNIVSSFFGSKFQRFIEELLVSPTPNWVILTGYVLGALALVTVVTLLLTSVMFAFAGFINAVYAKKFDDIAIVPTFILTPLTYLGGVFYSVSLLPPFWEKVSHLNPVLYMVNAFRYGLLGVSDVPLATAFAVMFAATIALGAFSMHLLIKGRGLRA